MISHFHMYHVQNQRGIFHTRLGRKPLPVERSGDARRKKEVKNIRIITPRPNEYAIMKGAIVGWRLGKASNIFLYSFYSHDYVRR